LDRKVNPTAVQRAFQRDGQGCLPLADSDGLGGRAVIPELDYPDVSANSVVMAALGGGHPEKHTVCQVVTGLHPGAVGVFGFLAESQTPWPLFPMAIGKRGGERSYTGSILKIAGHL